VEIDEWMIGGGGSPMCTCEFLLLKIYWEGTISIHLHIENPKFPNPTSWQAEGMVHCLPTDLSGIIIEAHREN
jgi:hypothetical protein